MTVTTPALPEDICLVSGIQQGHQQSLSILYDKYAPPLMGIILKIVRDQIIAEEILQKTFLLAWQQLRASDSLPDINAFAWLIQLARRTAIGSIKFPLQQNQGCHDIVNSLANGSANSNACSGTGQNTIFDLLFYKGLNGEEAASLLNITVQEVRNQFRSAVKSIVTVNVI